VGSPPSGVTHPGAFPSQGA